MTNKIIENLDKSDKINLLHLALNGQPTYAKYRYSDIEMYINYIKALLNTKNIKKDDEMKIEKSNKYKLNTQVSDVFFKNYQTKIKYDNKNTWLEEEIVIDLINRIKKTLDKSDTFALSNEQYTWLYGENSLELNNFINSLKLPQISPLYKKSYEYERLMNNLKNDELFNSTHEISNIYQVMTKPKIFGDDWTSKEVVHGTNNISLLHILEKGFKLSSQLKKENKNFRYSGSMFGDAIYFALPSQISKNIYYMDRTQTKYIILADIYYKDYKKVSAGANYKYTGENLIWATNIGRYSRDELMVKPSQINIKYILEVKEINKDKK